MKLGLRTLNPKPLKQKTLNAETHLQIQDSNLRALGSLQPFEETLANMKKVPSLSFSAQDDWEGKSGQIARAFSQMSGQTELWLLSCDARFQIFDLAL